MFLLPFPSLLDSTHRHSLSLSLLCSLYLTLLYSLSLSLSLSLTHTHTHTLALLVSCIYTSTRLHFSHIYSLNLSHPLLHSSCSFVPVSLRRGSVCVCVCVCLCVCACVCACVLSSHDPLTNGVK